MRTIKGFLVISFLSFFISCQSPYYKGKKKPIKIGLARNKTESKKEDKAPPVRKMVNLDDKGVGPAKNVELGESIDQSMADAGKEIFSTICAACHKPDKRFVGPAPKGILDRRSPEWVMNMILNPDGMVKEDPVAKELLAEYGTPMPNLGMTKEQARQILEYFRTL